MIETPLRICLLTYRGNPRSGGQGIYVRLLARELTELGHRVDVWSGPPYPELLPGARLVKVPSLDLWNEAAYLRRPRLRELRDPINALEYGSTVTGGFPEPITFTHRVVRRLRRRDRLHGYDIVHDNPSLGPGLLTLQEHLPVVATIHHPITVDRAIALQSAETWLRRYGQWRWYAFLRVQKMVARRVDRILTVSEASSRDLQRDYGVRADRMRVVGNGIDLGVFQPRPDVARAPDRLLTILSADAPLKGFPQLLEALGALRRDHPTLRLTVIGSPGLKSPTRRLMRELGLADAIEFTGKVSSEEIARRYAESTLAVVPSLYEGFGFPAGEAMACKVPVVSTRAGALPEVLGRSGECGLLVEPGSGRALAGAIDTLLRDPDRRAAMGEAGRRRVEALFTWRRAAERTVDVYREMVARWSEARAAC
jgi:glycosyltransferase involved in cell wall biosynthesis